MNLVFLLTLVVALPCMAQTEPTSIYISGTGFNRSAALFLQIGDKTYCNSGGRGLGLTIIDKSNLSLISDVTYDSK